MNGQSAQHAPSPPPASPPGGFFDTVRRLRVWRSSDRWVGGVAAGIAHRYGVDPLLVRGVFVVVTMFGGLGLVLYGLAWALLPEASDGRIHAEQAVRGHVDIALVGALVVLVIGISRPVFWWGASWWAVPWVVTLVAVTAAVLLSRSKGSTPPPAAHPGGPAQPGQPPYPGGPGGQPPYPGGFGGQPPSPGGPGGQPASPGGPGEQHPYPDGAVDEPPAPDGPGSRATSAAAASPRPAYDVPNEPVPADGTAPPADGTAPPVASSAGTALPSQSPHDPLEQPVPRTPSTDTPDAPSDETVTDPADAAPSDAPSGAALAEGTGTDPTPSPMDEPATDTATDPGTTSPDATDPAATDDTTSDTEVLPRTGSTPAYAATTERFVVTEPATQEQDVTAPLPEAASTAGYGTAAGHDEPVAPPTPPIANPAFDPPRTHSATAAGHEPAGPWTGGAGWGGGGWAGGSDWNGASTPPPQPPPPPVPGPGSRATSLVLALCLLGAAGIALAHHQGILDGSAWLVGGGAVLAVLGLGVLLSGMRGRSQGGIGVLGLIVALVMVPAAAATAALPGFSRFGTDADAFAGDPTWAPTTISDAEQGYTLVAGDLVVDLTELTQRGEATVPAGVTFGNLTVIVPDDANITVNARVGAGEVTGWLDDGWSGPGLPGGRSGRSDESLTGVGVSTTLSQEGDGVGPTIVVDAEVGFGQIIIEEAA